jgi:hypothetical protein
MYDVASGKKQLLNSGWGGMWSPDGKLIAFTDDSQLCVVNADGTNERCLTEKQHNATTILLGWSPDSRYVLISRAFMPAANSEIYRMDYTPQIPAWYGAGSLTTSWQSKSFVALSDQKREDGSNSILPQCQWSEFLARFTQPVLLPLSVRSSQQLPVYPLQAYSPFHLIIS